MGRWYKLDNAAKLFPSITNINNTSVFRISVVLKDKVDAGLLQQATDKIVGRFPTLTVRLRRGVFWNYFDSNTEKLHIVKERHYPCGEINAIENNGYLLKILYFGNRVSVEVFHSLTDGGGAIEFTKSLLYYYLKFSGKDIEPENKIIVAEDGVKNFELEDSFRNYYRKEAIHHAKNDKKAYSITGTPFDHFGNNVASGLVSASALNAAAKRKGCTITAYLTALLMYSIYESRPKYNDFDRPIVVAVPVNLRNQFPSRTFRNFSGVVNISMKMTPVLTFDELAQEVSKSLKEKAEKEQLGALIAHYVGFENLTAVRFVPLFIKDIVVRTSFGIAAQNKTMTFSNLGTIILPQGMYEHISHFETVLYPTKKSPISCSVCSVNDTLAITFSRAIAEKDIVQYFFSYLTESAGLAVKVYSNDWG
jgi:NRPS condensation-like uncharacterized protein